jgi:hypothetical protein
MVDLSYSGQGAKSQKVVDLDAIVEIFPVDGKPPGLNGPPAPLLGCGPGEPFQPPYPVQREPDLPAVAEGDIEHIPDETEASGGDMLGVFMA